MARSKRKNPLVCRLRRERWRAERAQGEKSGQTGAEGRDRTESPAPPRRRDSAGRRGRRLRPRAAGRRTARKAAAVKAPAATNAHVRKSMQGNKRANTKPELIVRKMLRELGYPGYRLDWGKLPGHPDIVYPARKLAILVNGCFWHRCPTCNPPDIKTHSEYWEAKFRRNVERDAENQEALERLGWTVVVIWEHELKKKNLEATRKRLQVIMETHDRL